MELEADLGHEGDHKLPFIKPWKTTIGMQNDSNPATKPIVDIADDADSNALPTLAPHAAEEPLNPCWRVRSGTRFELC